MEEHERSKTAHVEIRLAGHEPKQTTVYSHNPEQLLTSLKLAVENAAQKANFADESDSIVASTWLAERVCKSLWFVEHGQRKVSQAFEDLRMSLRKYPEEFVVRVLFIHRNRRVIPSWVKPDNGRGTNLSEEEYFLDALNRLQRVRDALENMLCSVAAEVGVEDWPMLILEALAHLGDAQQAFSLAQWDSQASL